MTQSYYSIITNNGLLKEAAANTPGGSAIDLTHIAVGDANGTSYNPTGAQNALVHEVYRTTLTHVAIDEANPNQLIVEGVINETIGPFTIREIGIFDSDGELFAIGKYPETYKSTSESGSGKRLYIRMILGFTNAPQVNLVMSEDLNNDPNFNANVLAAIDDINSAIAVINSALTQKLAKAQNLSDVSDIAQARSSLNVYSKSEINSLSKKNYIINGNFDFWQRGSSSTANGVYLADRFVSYNGDGARTYSKGTFTYGQTEVPNNPKYYLRHQQTAPASVSSPSIHQRIEDVKTLSGQAVIASFYAKVASGTLQVIPRFAQNFGSGGSVGVDTDGNTLTITSQWQKFTATVNIPSISGKTVGSASSLALILVLPKTITYDFCLAQVQLEKGSAATDFQFRHIAEELVLCQRYFQKSYPVDVDPQTVTGEGILSYFSDGVSMTQGGQLSYAPEMRTTPTVSVYNPATGAAGTGRRADGSAIAFTGMGGHNSRQGRFYFTVGQPTNTWITWHWAADAEL